MNEHDVQIAKLARLALAHPEWVSANGIKALGNYVHEQVAMIEKQPLGSAAERFSDAVAAGTAAMKKGRR